MTHPNVALVDEFYRAFAEGDAEAMARCYAPNARFSDPVFVGLEGDEPGDMWRMLCGRAKDLRVEHRDVVADDEKGSAHWEAWYTFGATGRKVHNVIDASFRFEDGLIVEHVDTFDFGAWSRQAIGLPAILLGWTGLIQKKAQSGAREQLSRFRARSNPT
jgi:ketosteroid isomerase-like protein